MSNFDNSDIEVIEGTLKVDVDSMTSEQQFNQWMVMKGVDKESGRNSNVDAVTSNILMKFLAHNLRSNIMQDYTEVCFDRSGHDRSENGHGQVSFDRACGGV